MMPSTASVVDLKTLRGTCMQCQVRELCLPSGLSEEEVREVDRAIEHRRLLKPGELLFHVGQAFRQLYLVHAGSVKTFVIDNEGKERVIGFHLAGEVLGLNAIAGKAHACAAQALETCGICEIPFDNLEKLAHGFPVLQHHLLSLMSHEIRQEELTILLGAASAEQRLAILLLNLSDRQRQRHLFAKAIRLSMSRRDIGNYLGLALETVSRVFTRLQRRGLIAVDGREVNINNLDALRLLADGGEMRNRDESNRA
jgi:CRP/FNR family transcriptional regulator